MPLSATAKREAFQQEGGEAWLVLLTIQHPDLSVPGDIIRVVNNETDIVSQGQVYRAFPFEFELPTDQEGETPRAKLRIDNVGEVDVDGVKVNLLHELRRLTSAPTLTIRVVLGATPDTVEHELAELTIERVTGDAASIEADLAYEDVLNQVFPALVYSPANAPGLFP